MATMSDEELIGYADIHCETERALFHCSHARRIMVMAGIAPPEPMPEFVAMHSEVMKPLLNEARRRLASRKKRETMGMKLIH